MTPSEIEKIFRDEAGRALATLIRLVGDFDLAEDALQEAFAIGLERWPAGDPPSNPRAWLVNVARNKAIDRIRRQGLTILLVEQNTRRALAVAQRAYVLVTGEVVLSGDAATLATDPRVQGAYLGEGVHLD